MKAQTNRLTFSQQFFIATMLFGLFFGAGNRTGLKKIPIPLDIPTLLRMSQLDLARILTENIVKNGYFQDIATGRNAAFTTGRSSWGLLYLIFA